MKTFNALSMLLAMAPVIKATPALPPHKVTPSEYNNFDISLIEKYDDADSYSGQGKCYKVHLKNTGNGYLDYLSFAFPKEGKNGRYQSYGFDSDFISSNSVLAPQQEMDVIISANYNTDSLNDFYIYASAYTQFTDEVTITGSKKIIYEEGSRDDKPHYFNRVDMSFDKENDKYCYSAIIKVEVDGTDYYFVVHSADQFYFDSSIRLGESNEKEVEVVKVLKTEYPYYEQSHSNLSPLYIFFIISPVIAVFVLASIIISVICIVRFRRKRL